MSGLILKTIARSLMMAIALSAGMAFVVVFLAFTRGAGILHDKTFVATIEVIAFSIPIASALFVVPNTLQEHRERGNPTKHESESAFWTPPE